MLEHDVRFDITEHHVGMGWCLGANIMLDRSFMSFVMHILSYGSMYQLIASVSMSYYPLGACVLQVVSGAAFLASFVIYCDLHDYSVATVLLPYCFYNIWDCFHNILDVVCMYLACMHYCACAWCLCADRFYGAPAR